MRKILLFLLFVAGSVQAQELRCTVKINYDRITNANTQIFKTLERSLNEFVNKTRWTNQTFAENERIESSMFINVSGYNSDQFSASIQVQSSRPGYNSMYASPVFNFNDKDFNFRYVEFENLIFNPNSYDSNLVSVMAFYSYIIMGLDADTFSPKGGTQYYELAQNVAILAQQGGSKGWNQADGNVSRYFLITDLMSNTFAPFREALYQYHSTGIDLMSEDLKRGKENIKNSVKTLAQIYDIRPNALLTRVFFDAKSDEIVSIYTGGPSIAIADLVENLNRISPLNSSKWGKIRF
ncbi:MULTISPECIES: DUF4835 family protein [Flavobacterium]|jgi:hypothetical protein|uniref:Uncharacterized protein DUF4835 n=1 Tax=Flavobacterium lindanitolerans TaxID=428988 RepID=A0A497UPG2_9FLAO|nr:MULTISPECIES: DUF4835 family protein [Flavobacterium]PZQ78945.1 MAG: DUF4835 domain-containing protein [Flavobacterium johnsoniae]MDQ7961933.1 DUF4835 family protein [Flavobacterium lindanitolerans]OJX48937.1 MAG: DUF4835 domain-containing protein [Flavobacterium sp. 38-13]PKW21023.1 uncharacterized protein DUF4835 [Flavobacterium lindanitolerans]RLJ30338.1 uncharacterized protein DUF4835 [Flavobacterium lindanitolerans]